MAVRRKAPRPSNARNSLQKRTPPQPFQALHSGQMVTIDFPVGGAFDLTSMPRNNDGTPAANLCASYIKNGVAHTATAVEVVNSGLSLQFTFSGTTTSAGQIFAWLPTYGSGDRSYLTCKGINGAFSMPVRLPTT